MFCARIQCAYIVFSLLCSSYSELCFSYNETSAFIHIFYLVTTVEITRNTTTITLILHKFWRCTHTRAPTRMHIQSMWVFIRRIFLWNQIDARHLCIHFWFYSLLSSCLDLLNQRSKCHLNIVCAMCCRCRCYCLLMPFVVGFWLMLLKESYIMKNET